MDIVPSCVEPSVGTLIGTLCDKWMPALDTLMPMPITLAGPVPLELCAGGSATSSIGTAEDVVATLVPALVALFCVPFDNNERFEPRDDDVVVAPADSVGDGKCDNLNPDALVRRGGDSGLMAPAVLEATCVCIGPGAEPEPLTVASVAI